jgi:hypothetical protein
MRRLTVTLGGAALFALASLTWTTARGDGDPELRETVFRPSAVFGVVEIVPDVPAKGCVVRFLGTGPARSGEERSSTCDARGYFVLRVASSPDALATFRFEMPGYRSIEPVTASFFVQPSIDAGIGSSSSLHGPLLVQFPPATDLGIVRLAAAGGIAGRIVGADADTLSTAAVQLEGTGNVVTPNPSGAFSLSRVSPGRHTVVLLVPGHTPERRTVEIWPGSVAMGVTFEIPAAALVPPNLPVPGQGRRFR